jgi:hypothetical protein
MNKINYGFKIFLSLLKESVILFIYMLLMGIISALIISINSIVGQIALFVVVILFFAFMCILLCKSLGETQYKNLVTGNIRRKKGNVDDVTKYCKPESEYRLYKGFLLGIIISSLTYILLIIRLFVGKSTNFDAAIRIVNLMYASLLSIFGTTTSVYYLALFTIINIAACGFGYYLGAKKIMLQQEKLQKTHEEIYGKGN